MINNVRNTVLFMLNKENRGYITPSEFNQFADLAQMSIFEDDFHAYAKAIVKQNARLYNNGNSDIPKHLRERIDLLTKESNLTYNATTLTWTNDDTSFYRLINLDYSGIDIEEVSKLELNKILKNNLIKPTEDYPVYVKVGDKFKIYPDLSTYDVGSLYIKRPAPPKWTYIEVQSSPLFNPSAVDYQDFEIHPSCETELVIKILAYCGMSIREADVVQATQGMEITEKQNQGL
tara:strand:+ start:21 stop:719 length:699 start_codon:yes stop_codon:yes gene_type:complete